MENRDAMLERLVRDHQRALFAFLYRMCGDRGVAEELMQETFVRALRALARYRPSGDGRAWLFSIAVNLVRDRWRRQAKRGITLSIDEVDLRAADSAEDETLERLAHQQVRHALLRLPWEQRTALILRYYHDLRYEEIAQVMACPVGTVRSRIHHGLARLKRLLSAEVITR
ncbi:MAG TPA: sigma-70 family RNA polymerase sigma factor [Calditerricola sp.]